MDFQAAAKALVPIEFRPVSDKESWGQSLLSGRQFLGLASVTFASLLSGLLLYYTFYVAFILSSIEAFPPSPEPPRPSIAGSYRRIMQHVKSSYGWHYFIGGAITFIWTALFAYVGRYALSTWALPATPSDHSIFALLGGSETIATFILEPFSIIFTHRILAPLNHSSIGTLKTILRSDALYISLIYIGTIRIVTAAAQTSLLVTDTTEHYSYPFATMTAYLSLLILRIVLVTRAHASLLPPAVVTTVDITQPAQFEPKALLWQVLVRALLMFRLLLVCVLLGLIHVVLSLAGIVYTSGLSGRVIDWVSRAKGGAQEVVHDPGFLMAHDPELDPNHFH